MNKQDEITIIHESLVNGQRVQMVDQINEYGLYEFWTDYKFYLSGVYVKLSVQYDYFADAVISYHRIINR